MQKTDELPFGNEIRSTDLFENRHWKLNLFGMMDCYNLMIQVSDVGELHCRCGGELPLMVLPHESIWSFVLVIEGQGKMVFRKKQTAFKAGSLPVVPPDAKVSFQITEEPFHAYRFLILDSGSLRDLFSQDISEPTVLHPRKPELLKQCFERTFQLLKQQNERTPLAVSAEAFVFLSELKRQCAAGEIPESFEQVCNEISHFPTRHYTLEKLAAACRMSVRSFQRRFARERHCSPQTFIMVCRLTIARRILRSSMLPIQDIAQRCRFNSTAQFSKSFKKYVGMSPRDYRKKFRRRNAEYYQLNQEKNGSNLWNLLPTEGLTPLQRQILWCMIENRNLKPKGIASQLDVPVSEVRTEMRKLEEKGVV